TRSIFVLDQNGTITYEEFVPEMSDEPDYQKALKEAKALI
ncbi:MAG: 2-Cys peroxiredoxin, partial [Tetragenococcus halophilus]|nr:2-Cys peroxiredoxin [Tetragenococcus halophilus]